MVGTSSSTPEGHATNNDTPLNLSPCPCPDLARHALRFLFQLGRQFDQRISYDNIEDLTRQPFAFLRFGMKSSGRIGLGFLG
jgi:hypothetical protein